MMRFVSTILITLLLNSAFGANAIAQASTVSTAGNAPGTEIARGETDSTKRSTAMETRKTPSTPDAGFDIKKADKETMASYQKNKAAGKKFSTQTKILIGAGIAAAIAGIVIYAASRDKVRTF